MRARAILRSFYFRPRYPFALATRERHRRAPQTPRRASRRADGRAVASSRSRPMRDPDHHAGIAKKGRRGPRVVRRNARDARARSHAVSSNCCAFPRRACDPPPINSVREPVANCLTRFRSMPVGKQPHQYRDF
jgi:hypothetical protein